MERPGTSDLERVIGALTEPGPYAHEPEGLVRSALAVIARATGEHPEPPDDALRDPSRTAAWLDEHLADAGLRREVVAAMAWDTHAPHTYVYGPDTLDQVAAYLRGDLPLRPGFALWAAPDGALTVADVQPGGAAEASGLRAGDVVRSVDGVPAVRTCDAVQPFVFAPPRAVFELAIERAGRPLVVRLCVDGHAVPAVTWRDLGEGVGYLNVRWFRWSARAASDAAAEAVRAITELRDRGSRALLVDLRSGIGGDPSTAAHIVSALTEAEVVMRYELTPGEGGTIVRNGTASWLGRPLAVVVNEQTVSSGEVLALALAELEGAALVGAPTAGGLQATRRIDLDDGSVLVVPLGRALGPRTGRAFPGHRLQPDVPVANPTAAQLAAGEDPALAAAHAWLAERVGP